MKNTIIPTLVIIALYASFSLGQAQNKKVVKNCCCEHTQQMAEDLRWIRNQLSKPYKAPPNVDYSDIGDVDVLDMKNPPEVNRPLPYSRKKR